MNLWIVFSVAAAVFQTVRFMLQKLLSAQKLSASGATFARFLYSAPLVSAAMAVWLTASGQGLPGLGAGFWAYGAAGGLAQIMATVFVVLLFKERNFAVGTTFAKTEVILTVPVGFVLLGDGVGPAGFGAILLGLVGVLLLSTTPGVGWRASRKVVGLGLGSGFLFAISGVCYRGASLAVMNDAPLVRAGLTLAAVTGMQMLAMAAWLAWRDRGQIAAVWAARRSAIWIGLTSMAGSFCWFAAFTLQAAAYVKAVGQVELILGLSASVLFFREKITGRELAGIAVLGAAIVALVLVI